MDYQANSNKSKNQEGENPKKIEKVISGDAISRKKPLGRKMKDLFIGADVKSVMAYVATDVLLPAARNMIVDASTKGIERMMYGDRAIQRRNGGFTSRVSYNSPVNRGFVQHRHISQQQDRATRRQTREDVILSSKEEADLVLERMQDVISDYEVVSLADLYDLIGFQTHHTDNKWGWSDLRGSQVQQIREGYLLDLPPIQPI